MIEYATAENACRSRMLLRYFGEKNQHNCKQCDVCLAHRAKDDLSEPTVKEIKEQIQLLLNEQPLTPAEIASHIEVNREELGETIQFLLEEGDLKMKDGMLSNGR